MQKKADTIDSIAQNKRSHAMKTILGPRTPKISTIEQKHQNHDRKSMDHNLKEMKSFLKRGQNQLSKNITFSENGDGMQKICMPECKTELWTSTAKTENKTASKLEKTYTNATGSEPAFRRYLVC